jgi:hypothetical protein
MGTNFGICCGLAAAAQLKPASRVCLRLRQIEIVSNSQ